MVFSKISSALLLLAGALFAQAQEPADKSSAPLTEVHLKDGSVLRGSTEEDRGDSLAFRTQGGILVVVSKDQIQGTEIVRKGKPAYNDGASRYLYAPSSYNLQQGEWQFSQKELLFTTLAYGLHPNISIQLGSALPFLFVEDGENFIGGLKVGHTWADRYGVQGGVQTAFSSAGAIVVPFGGVTFGGRETHASVNVAQFFFEDNQATLMDLAGVWRLNRTFSLVTENFLLFPHSKEAEDEFTVSSVESLYILALAMRFHAKSLMFDAGFLLLDDVNFPFPWVDISYSF